MTRIEIAGLVALAALVWGADALRSHAGRCALDGAEIDARFSVTAGELEFCSVPCAERWLARPGAERVDVLVHDSLTSRVLPASEAEYVRTFAAAAPGAIRVFASREDAVRHVASYGGEILTGPERPFAERHQQ